MSLHQGKIPATLTVLTKNSAKTLEKALESARDFDDIIVCDGGSTDGTIEIAKKFGVRIIMQDPSFLEGGKIFDYASVRNQTFEAAKHNWILWLDSDEFASKELIAAIRKIVSERGENGEGAFWVNRKYVIDGAIINCAATYPNRQMRFFAKRSTEGFVKRIHERIKLKEGSKREFLDEVMYIPFEPDIEKIRAKWDYQIAVAAEQVGKLSLPGFFEASFHCLKVSALWFARLAYNTLFCSGTKMPFKFEMERHRFHLKLLEAYWDRTHIGNKRIAEWFSPSEFLLFALGLLVTLVAATHHLAEAPGIWYDEGYFSQVAMNVAEHGAQLLQIAPGQFVSSGTVTAGFTLYYPVALFYKLFGVGVLQGRSMMVVYILILWFVSYIFIRKLFGAKIAGMSGLLVATLPLIYGNGKSILGEIPGLFYLVATFLALYYLAESEYRSMRLYAITGFIAGLCVITKPIYVLLLPAALLTYLFRSRRISLSGPGFVLALALFFAPVALWLHLQFGPGDTWNTMVTFYVNPYDVIDLRTALIQGLRRFVTDATSLYTILLLAAWIFSLIARRGKRLVSDAEVWAFLFCMMILAASLRLPSWNRYIFPATVIALMFLPIALRYSFEYLRTRASFFERIRWAPTCLVALLFIMQLYQLGFRSYVADYYPATRAHDVATAFAALDPHASFFIYNVPEVVVLLPNRNYYQFIMPHGDYEQVGAQELPLIQKGLPEYIVLSHGFYNEHMDMFPGYSFYAPANRYAILKKS